MVTTDYERMINLGVKVAITNVPEAISIWTPFRWAWGMRLH
jgi:hypothetical protein